MSTTRLQLIRLAEAKIQDQKSYISTYTPRLVRNILSVANATGGAVTVTVKNHGFKIDDIVIQAGTTDYNGTFTILSVPTDDTYTITETFTTTQTGTVTDDTEHGRPWGGLLEDIMKSALAELNNYDQRITIEDETGTASKIYSLSGLLANWDDSFSTVLSLKFPYDSTDEIQDDYDTDYYTVEHRLVGANTVKALVFLVETPTVLETIRIKYKSLHDLGTDVGDSITLSDQHVNALANFIAGSYLIESVSPSFLQNIDDTITADIVAQPPSQNAINAGLELIKAFHRHFGGSLDGGNTSGNASSLVGWKSNTIMGGDLFYH